MHVTPTPDQSLRIQVLRGLAILAVVAIHNALPQTEKIFLRPFLNFCVGLFLFLSGVLSDAQTTNPWKRLKKVLLPYFVWTAIYSFYYKFGDWGKFPLDFISRALVGGATPAMYYIFVYCELTLLIPLAGKLAESRYRYWGFVLSPVFIVAFRLIPVLFDMKLPSWLLCLRGFSCLEWSAYFYLGYLAGHRLIPIKISSKALIAMWILSIVLQMGEGYWYATLGERNIGTQLKMSSLLSGILFCLLSFRFVFANGKWHIWMTPLKVIGDCSFGIYFCHWLVLMMLIRIPAWNDCWWTIRVLASMSASLAVVALLKSLPLRFKMWLAV